MQAIEAKTVEPTETARAQTQPEFSPELHPEAWIGPAVDYQGEQRYGGWINMARVDSAVVTDVKTLMERTPPDLGSRWGMFAVRGFGYWRPTATDSLRAVAHAARNMVEFGLPYSALVAAVGPDSLAVSRERYALSFIGAFASRQAFAEQVASDSGWYERISDLPRSMQDFVRLDLDALIVEAERDLTIIDNHDGGVWVYDPRVW